MYRFREIHELKSYYDHEDETVKTVKELAKEGLIDEDEDSITITPKGKKLIKDCIIKKLNITQVGTPGFPKCWFCDFIAKDYSEMESHHRSKHPQ